LRKIGILTIGQSPRPDITSSLKAYLPKDILLVEAGVLDGMTREYVEKNMQPNKNEMVYISKMSDGSEVKLAKNKIIPIMQTRIRQLENQEVSFIVIFCTGEFPEFEAKVPLIYSGEVLKGLVSSFKYQQNVGVLVPIKEQINYAHKKWRSFFKNLIIFHASPYTSTESDFHTVAEEFKKAKVGLIIMDCMGYMFDQKRILKEHTNIPVISSRSILIRFLNELLDY